VSVGLVSHHAMRMRIVVLLSVACLVVQYFFTLSQKWDNFRKENIIEQETCVFIFPKISTESFLILEKFEYYTIIKVHTWARYLSRHSDCLRAGRPGDRILVGARFSAPVQNGPEDRPASCTMGTGSFPGGKVRPRRDADPSPLLVRRSKIE